ncbi:MAG: DUF1501 domain-containing protein [Opitutales bacterium]
MLLWSDDHGTPDCGGLTRRDFLRVGAVGLSGLTLPWWLRQNAIAKEAGVPDYVKDKAVVLLFCCGGPSQFETFDPHMEAPAPACSLTGEIKTKLPGVTFGATFEKLAKRADRLAVVRSYAPHDISDHAKAIKHVLTGGNALGHESGLGVFYSRLTGQAYDSAGCPTFTRLIEDELEDEYRQDRDRMLSGNRAGGLGPAFAPFDPLNGSGLDSDLNLNLPLSRLEDRRGLRGELDRLRRLADLSPALSASDKHRQQAVELLLGGSARKALDLSAEDPKIVARYSTEHLKTGWLSRRPSTLGHRMLMARRLVEVGCRFVTVGMAGWDNHGNGKHPGVVAGTRMLGSQLDHAVSAFLDDLKASGLDKKILLVITGEFGRTVAIQAKGGRNHWPGLGTLVFAGGGLEMGQVIGESETLANVPKTTPYKLEHLVGTLLRFGFDPGKLRLDTGLPLELVQLVETNKPITELGLG